MTYPSGLVVVGIAKEPAYGTATVPVMYLPVAPPAPGDVHTPIPDTGWRSSAVDSYGHQPGPLEGAVALAGPVFADTIGFALAGVLGDVTSAGSNPTTHTMAALNSGEQQPPSYTVTTSDPVGALAWAGSKFASLTLSATADGALTWAGQVHSQAAAAATTPAAAYTALSQFAGWRGVVQLGGATDTRVESLDVTLARTVTAKRNVDGARAPWLQRSGPLSVAGAMTIVMASDTYRQQYVNGTVTSVDINYQQGAGTGLQQIKLHCSTVTFTNVARTYSGSWVELAVAWTADANTADVGASGGYSPVKATLKNLVAAGVYA
ncbi:MAG TPA: phage tail tube protein [Jatrophihabitantaceae bacterium]|jgi:hypothetical protein